MRYIVGTLSVSLGALLARRVTKEALFSPTWLDRSLLVVGAPVIALVALLCVPLPRKIGASVVNWLVGSIS